MISMKEKVLFNAEKAQELINLHGLSKNTLQVWKTRGYIPSHYFEKNFSMNDLEKIDSVVEKKMQKDILKILKNRKIYLKNFLELAGVKNYALIDAKRKNKKTNLSKKALFLIKKQLNELKITVKNTIRKLIGKSTFSQKEKDSLDELLQDPRLHPSVVLKNCQRFVIDRFFARKSGKIIMKMEDQEALQIINELEIFLLEISWASSLT